MLHVAMNARVHCALWIAVLLCFVPGSPAAAEDEADIGERLQELRTAAMKASREMVSSLMPRPGVELGAEWRYPWDLPAVVDGAIPSEEAYWQKMDEDLGPSGVPENDARLLVELFTSSAAEQGMPVRDGLVTILHMVRGQNMAPHEAMQGGLETCIRLLEEARAMRASGGAPPEGDNSEDATRRLRKIINAPFEKMTDAQLKDAAIGDLSFLDRVTQMTFYKSNDWAAVARSHQEAFPGEGVWVGMVTVRIMMARPARAGEIEDLDAAALKQVQTKLTSTFQRAQSLIWQERERDLKEQLEAAHERGDRKAIDELEQQMWREQKALQGARIKIYARDFGDSCYVLQLTGASPDDLRLAASAYSARMHLGDGIVHISLAGNFPEAEMTQAMDKFLTEVEARTMALFE